MKPFHHLARGILIKNNKVLLAQAKGYDNTFLPGGHIELGESAKEALLREMQEELDITCTIAEFLGVVEHKWEQKGVWHYEINQVFKLSYDRPLEHVNSNETHLEFFWCESHELDEKNLQPYPFRKLIQNYLNGEKNIWWESTLSESIYT